MRAGQLRERVTIRDKCSSQDGFGAEVVTYSDWATVWASVTPAASSESTDQQREGATATHEVRMRYRPGLLMTMLVAWTCDGVERLLGIDSIVPDAARREIVLRCSEVPATANELTIGTSAVGGSGAIG